MEELCNNEKKKKSHFNFFLEIFTLKKILFLKNKPQAQHAQADVELLMYSRQNKTENTHLSYRIETRSLPIVMDLQPF